MCPPKVLRDGELLDGDDEDDGTLPKSLMRGDIIKVKELSTVPVDCLILNCVDEEGEIGYVALNTKFYDGFTNAQIKGGVAEKNKNSSGNKITRDVESLGRSELMVLRTEADFSDVEGELRCQPAKITNDAAVIEAQVSITKGLKEPYTYSASYKRDFVARGCNTLSGQSMWAIVLNPLAQCKKLVAAQLHTEMEFKRNAELARQKAQERRDAMAKQIGKDEDLPLEGLLTNVDPGGKAHEEFYAGIDQEKIHRENMKRMLMMGSIAVVLIVAIVLAIYFALLFSYSSTTTSSSLPGAPTFVSLTPSSETVTLTFQAPSNGASAVTQYEATVYLSAVNVTSILIPAVSACTPGVVCTSSPAVFTGLTNAIVYTFKIRAYNSVGVSEFSAEVSGTPTDYEALAMGKFYNAMNGTTWTTQTGWNPYVDIANYGQTTHPCSGWHGVTCVNNKITEINLNENNVGGTIPVEIEYLTSLQVLNLFDNQVTGELPQQFGYLTNLEEVNMNLNCLSGTLPTQLAYMTNMKILNIGLDTLNPGKLGGLCGTGISDIPDELGNFFQQVNGAGSRGIAGASCNLGGNQLTCPVPTTATECVGYSACA